MTTQVSEGPSAPLDPLSRPRAAFKNGRPRKLVQEDDGYFSQVNGVANGHQEDHGPNGSWEPRWDGDGERPETSRLETPASQVNPFHLLSHPHSPTASAPLPAHLEVLRIKTADGPKIVADFHQSAGLDDGPTDEPPIHITRVKRDAVEVTSGPGASGAVTSKIIQRVTKVFRNDIDGREAVVSEDRTVASKTSQPSDSTPETSRGYPPVMQGPPPSPPISDVDVVEYPEASPETENEIEHGHRISEEQELSATQDPRQGSPSRPAYTPMLTAEPGEMNASPDYFQHAESSSRPSSGHSYLAIPPGRRVSNSSTASRTGSLAIVRANRLAQQRPGGTASPTLVDGSPLTAIETSPLPTDHEPPRSSPTTTGFPRMSRRMTNPSPPVSANPKPIRSPLQHAHSTFASSNINIPSFDGPGLDPDILAQTEEIRRERLERRRRRAEAEAGAAATPAVLEAAPEPRRERAEGKQKEKEREEATKVMVGNLIGEDHVNYVLMYNMLTGIRIGVSRCQAKIKRPLTDEDFLARHKFSFDIVGNELTPSARYDFKFKDYAPWVFRDLRDDHFHLDPADYLLSLTAKYILSELGSPGKSGSFFYFSRDYRFIIKTISHSEHKFLRSILKDYHEHVKNNPHTLLSRFYGLHRVKLPRGRKIHFVIMNNLFPPHRDIHETYDLKGSAYGREYPEDKAKKNPKAVLKDKNWVNRARTLDLGPEKRALFSEQLRRDMEFLKKVHVMDYSLLVGIHNMERGNRDNLRETQLSVFHPEVRPVRRKPSAVKAPSQAYNVRKAVHRSDPKVLDVASQLPTADSADRRHFLFYQDEGGLRATDEANQAMDVIYYLGIIDICTPYNFVKKVEHLWKSMTEDGKTISCVDPNTYGRRFLNFLLSVMRGGDMSLRPPGLLPEQPEKEETAVGSETDHAMRMSDNATSATLPDASQDGGRNRAESWLRREAKAHHLGGIIPEENGDAHLSLSEEMERAHEQKQTEIDEKRGMFYGAGPMQRGQNGGWDKAGESGEARPAVVGHLKAD